VKLVPAQAWNGIVLACILRSLYCSLVLAFTRCSASTRKREGGERESLFLVIRDILNRESIPIAVMPDISNRESLPIAVIPDGCYRESILVWFRMDPRRLLAGMTEGGRHARRLVAGITKPLWSENSSSLAVSKQLRFFNADEFIEGTGWKNLLC